MGSFSIKHPAVIDRLKAEFIKADKKIDNVLMTRMNTAVGVVHKTASARRPKISAKQQKAMGRDPKGYRVSDPAAGFGVPVKSGDLQMSIKKDVKRQGERVVGRIYVDGPGARYAGYMEFGTSRIRPRSFLRSAMHINKDWMRRLFGEPIK